MTRRGVRRDQLHGFDRSDRLVSIPFERVTLVAGPHDHVGAKENGREFCVRAESLDPLVQGIAASRKP